VCPPSRRISVNLSAEDIIVRRWNEFIGTTSDIIRQELWMISRKMIAEMLASTNDYLGIAVVRSKGPPTRTIPSIHL
jgi:hypothetical protein